MAAMPSADRGQDAGFHYPERNLWAAARDDAIWLSGPVSERGASRAFRIALNMGGRQVHDRRLAMREHPIRRRLLDERPDPCAALNEMRALAALPEGSLGRAFHAFMDHPETILSRSTPIPTASATPATCARSTRIRPRRTPTATGSGTTTARSRSAWKHCRPSRT